MSKEPRVDVLRECRHVEAVLKFGGPLVQSRHPQISDKLGKYLKTKKKNTLNEKQHTPVLSPRDTRILAYSNQAVLEPSKSKKRSYYRPDTKVMS